MSAHQADQAGAYAGEHNRTRGRNTRAADIYGPAEDKRLTAAGADCLDVDADSQGARSDLVLQINRRIDAERDCEPLAGIDSVRLHGRVGAEGQTGRGHKGRHDRITGRQVRRACSLGKLDARERIVDRVEAQKAAVVEVHLCNRRGIRARVAEGEGYLIADWVAKLYEQLGLAYSGVEGIIIRDVNETVGYTSTGICAE